MWLIKQELISQMQNVAECRVLMIFVVGRPAGGMCFVLGAS